jgi:CheY-like chemotaxis protein
MTTLSILLLGETNRPEFRVARADLARWGAVREVAEVAAAAAALAAVEFAPDVIVIAQAFPGQFSPKEIDRLRRLAPLAPIIGLMGSWCEGETRSGSPWPATVRTYWHQWPARAEREFRRLAEGQCCSWALPPTATEEERLLADVGQVANLSHDDADRSGRGLAVIRSPSFEMADWLSAACRRRGLAVVWQRAPSAARVTGATAAIFDGGDFGQRECDELERFAAALRPASVVVLAAFPRAETRGRVLAAGAAAMLSKPVVIEDLFWQLDAATTHL